MFNGILNVIEFSTRYLFLRLHVFKKKKLRNLNDNFSPIIINGELELLSKWAYFFSSLLFGPFNFAFAFSNHGFVTNQMRNKIGKKIIYGPKTKGYTHVRDIYRFCTF